MGERHKAPCPICLQSTDALWRFDEYKICCEKCLDKMHELEQQLAEMREKGDIVKWRDELKKTEKKNN